MEMEKPSFCRFLILLYFSLMFLSETSFARVQNIGKIAVGFQTSQMNWIDDAGLFLISNNSEFGMGFVSTSDVPLFLLAVIHISSSTVIWSANRASPVSSSDIFVFDEKGNAFLEKGTTVVWSTETAGKGVSAMELQSSGNMVLLGKDSRVIWQSFSHPTDTLLLNQDFSEGMRLVSDPGGNNLTYFLEIGAGDLILSAGFQIPQPYWSMRKENRKAVNKNGGLVSSASLSSNSWRFYDQDRALLWQFIFSDTSDENATWIAVLGNDGFISFHYLPSSGSAMASPAKIPENTCQTPMPCGPNFVCYSSTKCQCPSVLSSRPNCQTGISKPCNASNVGSELVNVGNGIDYFALEYVNPSLKTDLDGCKSFCLANCSCLTLFFQNSSGHCYLFDDVGSFRQSSNASELVSYIKVSHNGDGGSSHGGRGSRKSVLPFTVIAAVFAAVLVFPGLIYAGLQQSKKKKKKKSRENSIEENFIEGLSGGPVRYSYRDLQTATSNFSAKLGHGGFGSVYQGILPDGTRIAVKKLEHIGQGQKEFRAEVSIIGSIHHVHLVKLKGFCAEGLDRLLAYEYMSKGSLDKWIFKRNEDDFFLDWETRFNIALGTAKGLAYLHQECDSKIIHCDIKPENVLLDDNFHAKVSDFGLAKLVSREQSRVFTTMRGTRGYLAPEWIANVAISEKSDVYSYGIVLLEMIGGRKNFDPFETPEKSHLLTYAFKMLDEGKLAEIFDSKMSIDQSDDRVFSAVKVALWCIQEDMNLRPPMTKVVQMLEGLCSVPHPPTMNPLRSRLISGVSNSSNKEQTSSRPSDSNSDTYVSNVRLSGPR